MTAHPDLTGAVWVRSSYSNGLGGECVEFAPDVARATGAVPVRDSKLPTGPALFIPAPAWRSFITAAAGAAS
ncbi:DUF397 domain-containing protein [Streptomyces sp. DSM 44917]|uniref:DUF397 domain-containing protein n=1 Tax=Streptomyces boetiae TaxID=3075541 RepID=A0ABU2L3S4_9ACTN|nr:DUF397 domain-containing protein [Streptomyces sp. DSM 44917]MDT0306216.1 DUF397 domain-containing protein [Streptomyces sp. DSM 44917]